MFKKISLFILTMSFLFLSAHVFADSFDKIVGSDGTLSQSSGNIVGTGSESTGLSTTSVPILIGNAVKITLGFFGAVALFFIIWGGFSWMMSQGDPKQILAARNRMITAVIGMVIIATSYAITDFVLSQISVIAG